MNEKIITWFEEVRQVVTAVLKEWFIACIESYLTYKGG